MSAFELIGLTMFILAGLLLTLGVLDAFLSRKKQLQWEKENWGLRSFRERVAEQREVPR